jgi:hypothetical protein
MEIEDTTTERTVVDLEEEKEEVPIPPAPTPIAGESVPPRATEVSALIPLALMQAAEGLVPPPPPEPPAPTPAALAQTAEG